MADSCDEDSGSGPISRSSVTHVAYIVSKFSEEKKHLVREIGFGGILELPQITKVDRKFTLWLLSKLNLDRKCIIVNGEPVADVIDFEVARIMGIPCGRKIVCPLESDDKKRKLEFIQNFIGSPVSENNSLTAAESIIKAEYDTTNGMSMKDKNNFKVSFVVWVMGHLLAPTKKYNVGADRFWGALVDPDVIKEYNWSSYVIDELIAAARDVQDAMKQKKNINSITGCSILLQILYFESINMGSLNRPKGIKPRVKAYDAKSLSLMIAADKASSSSGSSNPTWGSNVRHLPEHVDEQTEVPNNDDKILNPTEHVLITDLGKYVRDNFGDKVTTAQSVALNWFNARCFKHYNQLRLNIQRDTVALVGKLFGSSTLSASPVPSEPLLSMDEANIPPLSQPSRQANSEPSRTILKKKRPYGSAYTPYNRRYNNRHRVSFRQYELPETLLTGGSSRYNEDDVIDQQSDSGHHSTTASQCSGFPIEAPSFDLGIEFDAESTEHPLAQTTEQLPLPSITNPLCSNKDVSRALDFTNSLTDVSPTEKISQTDSSGLSLSMNNELCAGSSTPGCFKPLTGTPPSGKSINQPEFSTSDQIFKNCTTSPGSLSKILAEGDLVDRMTRSDDSPNINIKPWDAGYSEEPIEKRIVRCAEMSESPWETILCHRNPPRDIVEKFFDDVSICDLSCLNRPWVAHTSPRHIEIDGIWIRKSFIPEAVLTYDVCDLAIRRLKQLDDLMYSRTSKSHWRHMFESEFAILALSGEAAYDRKAIIEQFVGPSLQYRLENCRMIVVPAFILLNWSSYFFDFKDSCVRVIDPLYNKYQSAVFHKIHRPNISKIADSMMKCFVMFFENWQPKLEEWDVKFVEPPIPDATSVETGLLNLFYIRQFDGSKFHSVNRDSFCYFKKVMLYELMSLSNNLVKAPLNLPITIDD